MRLTVFSDDMQTSPMDMPFNGSRLFRRKADSTLEQFKDSPSTITGLNASEAIFPPFHEMESTPGG